MIFYVKKMKKPFAGRAYGPIILILKEYRKDKGLIEHEKVHVTQWWKGGLIVHSLRMRFSRKYRYACEIEAYRKQLEYSPDAIEYFADMIYNQYKLNVNYDRIIKDLIK